VTVLTPSFQGLGLTTAIGDKLRLSAIFETWLETCLLPTLQPGQVVILDNATFHHGGRIAELIESVGCRILYLPAYSPDLNRIENCWAWLKNRIRKFLSSSASLRQAMESVLKDAVS
jgi:transposase